MPPEALPSTPVRARRWRPRWCAALLLACAGLAACSRPDPRLIIHEVSIVDTRAGVLRPQMSLVIQGDRISSVAPSDSVNPDRRDRVIDGTGRFVIPGLWDLHVHLSKAKAEALALLVANGVTSVRDMGGDLDELKEMRRRVAAGELAGPRIFMAGPMLESPAILERARDLTSAERWEVTRVPVADIARAAVVVDSLVKLGVDFIKVREYESLETFQAIIRAAHARGKPVFAHPPYSLEPVVAAELGIASFEHASYPYPLPSNPAARARLLDAWRQHGVVLVPTLVAWWSNVMNPDSLALLIADSLGRRDPRRPLISRHLADEWAADLRDLEPRSAGYYEGYGGFLHQHNQDLGVLHQAGIPILPGSDLAGIGLFPGFALHDELQNLVTMVGMTPAEAIDRATRQAARLLGADSLGTLEAGKLADLVLLAADPLVDIRNTRKLVGVVANGKYLDRATINDLLRGVDPTATASIDLWPDFEDP